MKPEHTKPFNVEHAKAGAPYCQRNGLPAWVMRWERQSLNYGISGDRRLTSGVDSTASWTVKGAQFSDGTKSDNDLVMLPLGYCEGKPVFVGDKLEDTRAKNVFYYFKASDVGADFTHTTWPRTAPVMPHLFSPYVEREYIIEDIIKTKRTEIEAYWKALDEFNGVKA
jgi:hypothetical protein